MANPSKAKGTAAESAVVKYMREHGFGGCDRQPLRGNRDAGDLALTVGVVLEVKAHKGAPGLGQPAQAQLTSWMAQSEAERRNAHADYCPLIVKRSGCADVGRWWAYLPARDVGKLMHALNFPTADVGPIAMTVASLVALLRTAGHGDPVSVAS